MADNNAQVEVRFDYDGQSEPMQVSALCGIETLGAAHHFELKVSANEVLDGADMLDKTAVVTITTVCGVYRWHGAIDGFVAIATAAVQPGRRYRVRLRGDWHALAYCRRRRVWQGMSAPDMIKQLFEEAGMAAPKLALTGEHAALAVQTQMDESDETFVRRLMEQEGLWLRRNRHDDDNDGETAAWVLCDSIDGAAKTAALRVMDGTGFEALEPCAWDVTFSRRRAIGKVSLASYDATHPRVDLIAHVNGGSDSEQGHEHYCHRASRYGTAALNQQQLKQAAGRRLAALRTGATTVSFFCNVAVAVGSQVTLLGQHEQHVFVTQLRCQWRAASGGLRFEVTATPAAAGYALPAITPKPTLPGACLATVTGTANEEIHCDELGRVRVRFHWDRPGAADERASQPVRVAQPQLAGAMLVPRVGWEVVVMFEDGDPDSAYVLGRLDNGQHVPAAALPANKSMTRLASYSSPAGGGCNAITMEDSAGRQGLGLVAAKDMRLTIAGNMLAQTAAVDELNVGADRALSIGGDQTIAVQNGALVESCTSQSIVVGGEHSLQTPKAMALSAATVTVSAATLNEQVGAAGGGLGDLAKTAAFTAMGALGGAKGMALVTAAKTAMAYQQGGTKAAASSVLKTAAAMVPGVGTAMEVAEGSGAAPWQPQQAKEEGRAEDASSAAGGAQGGQGADQGGSGRRVITVGGDMHESIGGAYMINTPGSSSWTSMGLRCLAIGGNHNIAAGMYSFQTLGAAAVVAPAMAIDSAGSLVRTGRLMKVTVAGGLSCATAGDMVIRGGNGLTLNAGSLTLTGKVVLVCGGSKVTLSSDGIVAEAASVTFLGSTQAAEATQ